MGTLLSVLEPFLRDPTVQWDRQGKSIQFGHLGPGGGTTHGAGLGGGVGTRGGSSAGNGGLLAINTGGDSRPQALTVVDERLMGIYNLKVNTHPNRNGSSSSNSTNRSSRKAKHDRKEEQTDEEQEREQQQAYEKDPKIPLAVEGQVQKLIEEATSINSLMMMYIGWMPWV